MNALALKFVWESTDFFSSFPSNDVPIAFKFVEFKQKLFRFFTQFFLQVFLTLSFLLLDFLQIFQQKHQSNKLLQFLKASHFQLLPPIHKYWSILIHHLEFARKFCKYFLNTLPRIFQGKLHLRKSISFKVDWLKCLKAMDVEF